MMVKWANDGLLQANDGKMLVNAGEMLVNDGEMLFNDGEMSIWSYEVPSIKNANLSIKYELIKLQKFQIAGKKGINVVVRFQYSEISWD